MFQYIRYADMLKQIIQKKRQLKDVIYRQNKPKSKEFSDSNQNKRSPDVNISATYSLLSLVTNNYPKFEEFIEKIQKRTRSQIKNYFLLIVMTGEFVNLGKIRGGGKVKKIIMQNIDLLPQIKKQTKINKQTAQIRLIENQKMDNLEGSQDQQDSFLKWKNIFQNEKAFQKNPFIKNMFNLTSDQYKSILQQHPVLLKSRFAVIQSFSSSLPPFLLLDGVQKSELKNFRVIDACSAPGNKTIQLSEYVYNGLFKRKVLAFQKDPKRFGILNRTLARFNSCKNVKSFNQNFLQTDPLQQRFNRVKFVLLDPSCSGSGMLSNYLRDLGNDQQNVDKMKFQDFCDYQYSILKEDEKQRVQNLHNFQLELLNHTAKFQPKRISYSTCSVYRRENEDVVAQFLKQNPSYRLKQNKIITNNVGKFSIESGFDQYKFCVRMDPRKRQTDGFFVAVFYKSPISKQQ